MYFQCTSNVLTMYFQCTASCIHPEAMHSVKNQTSIHTPHAYREVGEAVVPPLEVTRLGAVGALDKGQAEGFTCTRV